MAAQLDRHTADASVRGDGRVFVWDLPTRIFHWLLVGLIVFAWVSYEFSGAFGDPAMKLHRYNGYAIAILIIWRVLWGVFGSSTSRFSGFVRGPATVLSYAKTLVSGRDQPFFGHNPLGAYGVVVLLAAVTFQAVLGLQAEEQNMTTWGPLSHLPDEATKKAITELHGSFYNVILVLAAVHIVAGLYHVFLRREPLIKAMITGHKPNRDYAARPRHAPLAAPASLLRAFGLLVVAAGVFAVAIIALGGRLFY